MRRSRRRALSFAQKEQYVFEKTSTPGIAMVRSTIAVHLFQEGRKKNTTPAQPHKLREKTKKRRAVERNQWCGKERSRKKKKKKSHPSLPSHTLSPPLRPSHRSVAELRERGEAIFHLVPVPQHVAVATVPVAEPRKPGLVTVVLSGKTGGVRGAGCGVRWEGGQAC